MTLQMMTFLCNELQLESMLYTYLDGEEVQREWGWVIGGTVEYGITCTPHLLILSIFTDSFHVWEREREVCKLAHTLQMHGFLFKHTYRITSKGHNSILRYESKFLRSNP